jgi:hypothetical protein
MEQPDRKSILNAFGMYNQHKLLGSNPEVEMNPAGNPLD